MHKIFKPKPRFGDSSVVTSSTNAQSEPPHESPISPLIPPSIPNETNQNGIYLESDPAKRKQIIEYHPNDQDEVRRAYLLKKPTRIYMNDFPIDDKSSVNRKFSST
ncbi:hypothetical protein LIER_33273 [Lithospermum erythrorhizon]|uniref:Uncharacterized protein n=1 Tax=Lithospermum erythrorhizon TaxID=34254 RepID=A0AAV3PEN6_LITER